MANSRLKTTLRDMVLTLAVISLPLGAGMLIHPSKAGNPVHVIDAAAFESSLAAARSAEPFTVVAPNGLPADWRATSESYQLPGNSAAIWHVGYLTPSGGYAQLDQTTQSLAGYLSGQHSDAVSGIAVQVGGETWQRYTGSTPPALRILLIHTDPKSTEIVAGSATLSELEQLVGALK
jgi:hypothetical protein